MRRASVIPPEDVDDLEPILAVLAQAYPRAGRNQCIRWLLGEGVLDEKDRVLLAAARRASRLRLRFVELRAAIWRGELTA